MFSFIHHFQIAIKNLNKEVATKEYLSKFLPREIEILQRMQHPNIVQVFQIIETEKKAFLMLELAENGDLLDYINSRRHLHEPEARFIFRQMSSGIAYCHSLDIIHRDLKCENIMLSRDMDVKIGGKSLEKRSTHLGSNNPSNYVRHGILFIITYTLFSFFFLQILDLLFRPAGVFQPHLVVRTAMQHQSYSLPMESHTMARKLTCGACKYSNYFCPLLAPCNVLFRVLIIY